LAVGPGRPHPANLVALLGIFAIVALTVIFREQLNPGAIMPFPIYQVTVRELMYIDRTYEAEDSSVRGAVAIVLRAIECNLAIAAAWLAAS
jgi:hypothetical protein